MQKQCLCILLFHSVFNNPNLRVKKWSVANAGDPHYLSFPSSAHKNSFYYSCFSKIKPGAPAISKPPKCQEVPQDNMKNKNNEKHDFLSIHLVQLEGIRHFFLHLYLPFTEQANIKRSKVFTPHWGRTWNSIFRDEWVK